MTNFEDKLKLRKGKIYLVSGTEKTHPQSDVLQYLLGEQKRKVIYVTLTTPIAVLSKKLKQKKVDCSNIFFIDLASRDFIKVKNCIKIKPTEMMELFLAIQMAIDYFTVHKTASTSITIVIDSLTKIPDGFDALSLLQFIKTMVKNTRWEDMSAIAIYLEHALSPADLSKFKSYYDEKIVL
jgi:hypothetical protein